MWLHIERMVDLGGAGKKGVRLKAVSGDRTGVEGAGGWGWEVVRLGYGYGGFGCLEGMKEATSSD